VELTQLHLHPTVGFFTRENNILSRRNCVTTWITTWQDVFLRRLISPVPVVVGIALQANLPYLLAARSPK
jgi:hypothetical protein